jgi:hypothetical protein
MTEFQCGEEQVTSWSFRSRAEFDTYAAAHPELHFHGLRPLHDDLHLFPAPAAFCVPKQHSYESIPPNDDQ